MKPVRFDFPEFPKDTKGPNDPKIEKWIKECAKRINAIKQKHKKPQGE